MYYMDELLKVPILFVAVFHSLEPFYCQTISSPVCYLNINFDFCIKLVLNSILIKLMSDLTVEIEPRFDSS